MGKARLGEAKAGNKIAGRNISNLIYTDDTTLKTESEEELKSISMKVKEKSEKVGLKLNIQKKKIMVFSSIISWQIDGQTMETVTDFIFLGSKITADGDCSHKIKRWLTPWKESYYQPRQHIKKQRYYFTSKGLTSQSYGFSSSHIWMWELDLKQGWGTKEMMLSNCGLEKILKSPLDNKETKPVSPKESALNVHWKD